MTTVQYGGGPTLEQRRAFANLRPGSHIPGYAGYNPQLKFVSGKSYGELTADLAQTHPHKSTVDVGSASSAQPASAPALKLPKPSGDNKYMEGMLPGYTGYVPSLLYRFGGTYRHLCDESVDGLVRGYERQQGRSAELIRSASSLPQLQSLRGDPTVRDHMNFWVDRQPKSEAKRSNPEPPIPGYKGFVPRVYSTQAGLGCRYHEMTRNGLSKFEAETAGARAATARPGLTISQQSQQQQQQSQQPPQVPLEGSRLYRSEGMKPAYTGYVPRRRFNFGHTYGDTTRGLPVCTHPYPSYGSFVRSLTAK